MVVPVFVPVFIVPVLITPVFVVPVVQTIIILNPLITGRQSPVVVSVIPVVCALVGRATRKAATMKNIQSSFLFMTIYIR